MRKSPDTRTDKHDKRKERVFDDEGDERIGGEREATQGKIGKALKKDGFGCIVGKGDYFGILADRSHW